MLPSSRATPAAMFVGLATALLALITTAAPAGAADGDDLICAGALSRSWSVPSGCAVPSKLLWQIADHTESDDPQVAYVAAPETGTLILVRHADRDPNETDLNAQGRERAAALPAVLADLPIDAILIPDLARNVDTAAPLATMRGVEPRILVPDSTLATSLAQAADGRTAIWIGNVGNLTELWDAYRLPGRAPIDYGQIAILTAEDGQWRIARRTVNP